MRQDKLIDTPERAAQCVKEAKEQFLSEFANFKSEYAELKWEESDLNLNLSVVDKSNGEIIYGFEVILIDYLPVTGYDVYVFVYKLKHMVEKMIVLKILHKSICTW